MGVTTDKSIFFHLPRTGGTWVEESLKRAFPNSEKLIVDFGWELPVNGIHVPPTKFHDFDKFSYTFVRHPLAWYKSYYQFLVEDKTFDEFINKWLGKYTELVKKFEQVDFVGKAEYLYFDLCDALEEAGEEFDETDFLSQHVNRSTGNVEATDTQRQKILTAESYVVEKYYEN